MRLPHRQICFRESDFQQTWQEMSRVGSIFGSKRNRNRASDLLNLTASYVGGSLYSDGFSLFHNGGLPLIERREGPMIEEILLRPGRTILPDGSLPLRITLHLNHLGLQESRMRYWPSPTRAPSVVASIDVGQLEIPTCWPIWLVSEDQTEKIDIVDWIQRLALPWFDLFRSEAELRRRLFQEKLPLVGLDTSLELVIAEFGALEGARFLDQCVLARPGMGERIRSQTLRIMRAKEASKIGNSVEDNLSAVAASFRLINR